MDMDFYESRAMRTDIHEEQSPNEQLTNALMGLCGESGECIDIWKKSMYQGHPFDENHFIEELGDVLWYLDKCARAVGTSLSEVAQRNIDKLYKRYPKGFDSNRSVYRTDT